MILVNVVLFIKEMVDKVFEEMLVGRRYVIVFFLKFIFYILVNLLFVYLFGFMIFFCFYESYSYLKSKFLFIIKLLKVV